LKKHSKVEKPAELPEINEDIEKSQKEAEFLNRKLTILDMIVKHGQKSFDVNSDAALRKKQNTKLFEEVDGALKELLEDKEITKFLDEVKKCLETLIEIDKNIANIDRKTEKTLAPMSATTTGGHSVNYANAKNNFKRRNLSDSFKHPKTSAFGKKGFKKSSTDREKFASPLNKSGLG